MENISAFSMVINYYEESTGWGSIWNNSLKSQLNSHFVNIKYEDHSIMKPFSSLNILMQNVISFTIGLNLYIIKYNP